MIRRLSIWRLAVCCALVAAAPLSAYTIVFKDGSSVVTLDKYRIVGDQAIVTMPSGTPTTFPAAEIDVETTEEMNRMGMKRGILLRGPDPRTSDDSPRRGDTIADLVRGGYGELRIPDSERSARLKTTRAGNPDLFTLERKEPLNARLAEAFREALQPVDALFFAGSHPSRLLVDLTTESEREVFSSLTASARALLATRRVFPELSNVELLMSTQDRRRAAQFVLAPEAAQALVDGTISPSDFFLLNVQF